MSIKKCLFQFPVQQRMFFLACSLENLCRGCWGRRWRRAWRGPTAPGTQGTQSTCAAIFFFKSHNSALFRKNQTEMILQIFRILIFSIFSLKFKIFVKANFEKISGSLFLAILQQKSVIFFFFPKWPTLLPHMLMARPLYFFCCCLYLASSASQAHLAPS